MGNPAVLRTIAANPAAYPDSPASPVARVPDAGAEAGAPEAPKAEPVALHEQATAVKEAIAAARSALEDLAASAEMAESIDPEVEKAISAASDELGEVDDDIAECLEKLGDARQEHEDLMDGGGE